MNEKLTIEDCMLYPNARIYNEKLGKYYHNLEDYIKGHFFAVWFKHDTTINIEDCRLQLRPSLTEEEKKEFEEKFLTMHEVTIKDLGGINEAIAFLLDVLSFEKVINLINFFRSINIDIDGFIASGKAVAE